MSYHVLICPNCPMRDSDQYDIITRFYTEFNLRTFVGVFFFPTTIFFQFGHFPTPTPPLQLAPHLFIFLLMRRQTEEESAIHPLPRT